jgi:hypothetical protein
LKGQPEVSMQSNACAYGRRRLDLNSLQRTDAYLGIWESSPAQVERSATVITHAVGYHQSRVDERRKLRSASCERNEDRRGERASCKLETKTNLSTNTTIPEKFDLNELGAVETAKYEPEGVERLVEAEGGREINSSRSRTGAAKTRGIRRRMMEEIE